MRKMFFIGLISLLFLNACRSTVRYYEGFIYDTNRKPVAGLRVCEQYTENCTKTNTSGFFQLKKDKKMIRSLIVFDGNNPIDTVSTVWNQHGEQIVYSFIESQRDTLFIDVSR